MKLSRFKWNDKKRTYRRGLTKLGFIVTLFVALMAFAAVTQIDAGSQLKGIVKEVNGGTNQSSYTLGDTLYASGSNALSKLAGNITTTNKFKCQVGTGSASQAPAWCVLLAADIPSLDAGKITTGTIATARLGSGTANASSYLRGDQTWATIPGALSVLANETPSGTIDGVNAVFTTLHPCVNLYLFKNGQRMTAGAAADYQYATSTITFTASGKPLTGDVLLDDCEY